MNLSKTIASRVRTFRKAKRFAPLRRFLLLFVYVGLPILLLIGIFSLSGSKATLPLTKEVQQIQNRIAPPKPLSWLTTSGNSIVDEQGKEVILRGVNLAGVDWQQGSWNTKALKHAASRWKVNVIRTRVPQAEFLEDPELLFDQLETEILNQARRDNLYVILDPKFEHNRSLPDEGTTRMWTAIADRYKNDSHILYDLLSEPHDVSHAVVYNAYLDLIPAVREVNPRALIFVTGTGWGRAINPYLTQPLPFENIVYRSNPYNRAGEFEGLFGRLSEQYPVFIAEFGADAIPYMSRESVGSLLDYADRLGLGWTAWVFHSQGCPCLLKNDRTFEPSEYGKLVLNALLKGQTTPTDKQTFTEFIAEEQRGFAIYDDALQHAFNDLSWESDVDLQNRTNVYDGRFAIEVKLTPSTGLYFHTWTPVSASGKSNLSFYLATPQVLTAQVWLKDEAGADMTHVSLSSFATADREGWAHVTIPLSTLNPQGKIISGLVIGNFQSPPSEPIYLDEIRLP